MLAKLNLKKKNWSVTSRKKFNPGIGSGSSSVCYSDFTPEEKGVNAN